MPPAPKTLWSWARGDSGRHPAYSCMLRTAARWTLAPGALVAGGWARWHGVPAGASFAVGVLAVAALFASGMWGLALVLRGASQLAQAGAFAILFLQMYVGLLLVAAGRQVAWIDASALAAGAIGATLVWQAGLIAGFATTRRPVYSRDDVGPRGAPGAHATSAAGIRMTDRQEGDRR